MRRIATLTLVIALVAAACASSAPEGPLPDPPPPVTFEEMTAMIESAGGPVMVNVWASWCLPCRSEAPLIAAGTKTHPNVTFIGLNVQDNPTDASQFMAEYLSEADMTHVSNSKGDIPVKLGGTRGVPISFFYRANGELAATHLGIIDEPTLARFLDEIDR
jgi:cytochrome c biogenesis protein CcmG/thiol:disulfide interchange protein DsbE